MSIKQDFIDKIKNISNKDLELAIDETAAFFSIPNEDKLKKDGEKFREFLENEKKETETRLTETIKSKLSEDGKSFKFEEESLKAQLNDIFILMSCNDLIRKSDEELSHLVIFHNKNNELELIAIEDTDKPMSIILSAILNKFTANHSGDEKRKKGGMVFSININFKKLFQKFFGVFLLFVLLKSELFSGVKTSAMNALASVPENRIVKDALMKIIDKNVPHISKTDRFNTARDEPDVNAYVNLKNNIKDIIGKHNVHAFANSIDAALNDPDAHEGSNRALEFVGKFIDKAVDFSEMRIVQLADTLLFQTGAFEASRREFTSTVLTKKLLESGLSTRQVVNMLTVGQYAIRSYLDYAEQSEAYERTIIRSVANDVLYQASSLLPDPLIKRIIRSYLKLCEHNTPKEKKANIALLKQTYAELVMGKESLLKIMDFFGEEAGPDTVLSIPKATLKLLGVITKNVADRTRARVEEIGAHEVAFNGLGGGRRKQTKKNKTKYISKRKKQFKYSRRPKI
jgi:hypothetical protein